MSNKKTFFIFLGSYFALRIFSFFFSPQTPLLPSSALNTAVSILILSLAVYWLLKKDERAWYLIFGEIILGGGGNFLDIKGIALRSCLLISAAAIFCLRQITDKSRERFYIFALALLAAVSGLRGLYLGHDRALVYADFIPYLFLFYFFPLRELLRRQNFVKFLYDAGLAAIIGNFIFIIFTFYGFATGLFHLQDAYYHWYRDAALGKITDLGGNFFRLVLNEHLYLAPLLLVLARKMIKEGNTNSARLSLPILFILAVNFTRIYILGLGAGLIALYQKNSRHYLAVCAFIILGGLSMFTAVNLTASGGQNTGWDLLGIRLGSLTRPTSEDSSFSRLLLLPPILDKIKTRPILGQGLGDTVAVYSPVLKQTIATPHFDWGYLEIIAETGLVGLLLWLAFLIFIIKKSWRLRPDHPEILAVVVSFLVINLTSPALFHGFGFLLLTFLLAL